jgi:ribosomal protein L11 methylase PrmA
MTAPDDGRSLGELFGSLTTQLGQLVQKEVELARTEIQANALQAARNASLVGVGAVVAHAGFLALVAAAIAGLVALGIYPWMAALLAGVVLVAAGGLLVQRGRARLEAASLAPKRTIETLKDDADWAREQTR